MSEKLRESLSAIVDGEADEFELRRVLDEVDKSPELRAAWERYHLVGAVLRSEHTELDGRLRERVHAALELEDNAEAAVPEPATRAQETPRPSRLGRWSGVAVAATVALAVVVGLSGGEDNTLTPQVAVVEPAAAPPSAAQPTPAGQDEATRRLQAAYMLHHAQQVGMNQPGVAAFAKMVTYQGR